MAGKGEAKGRSQVSGGKRWTLIGWDREAGWSLYEFVVSREEIVDRAATLVEIGTHGRKEVWTVPKRLS
jgi:hypothetical protein